MKSADRINKMYALFGELPDKMCEECSNLVKISAYGEIHRKCKVYGVGNSQSSDWRKKYTACGMYNREYNGVNANRIQMRKKKMNEGENSGGEDAV